MKIVESPGDSKEDTVSHPKFLYHRSVFGEPAVEQVTNGLSMRRTARCFQSLKKVGVSGHDVNSGLI